MCGGVEIVARVIEVEDAAVAPELLRVGEQVALVGGHGDGNRSRGGEPVFLALVAVVVGVEDPVGLGDPEVAEMIEDLARTEVDQNGARAVADDVDAGGVLEEPQVFAEPPGRRRWRQPAPAVIGKLTRLRLRGGGEGRADGSGRTQKLAAGRFRPADILSQFGRCRLRGFASPRFPEFPRAGVWTSGFQRATMMVSTFTVAEGKARPRGRGSEWSRGGRGSTAS